MPKTCKYTAKETIYNSEYGRQLIRSSGSPGANYMEAIEAASRRDFTYKLKTCRKEIKESLHWLRLVKSSNEETKTAQIESENLIKEGLELIRIFTSSILTSEKNREIGK